MTRSRRLLLTQTQGPARRLSAMALSVGPQALLWVVAPRVAVAVIGTEVVLAAVMFLIALFGTDKLSERAFRILSLSATGQQDLAADVRTAATRGVSMVATDC
jgi:hypothetical protein